MDGGVSLTVASDMDIIVARELGRKVGKELNFSQTDLTIIATVISELARNIIVFANKGSIIVKKIKQGSKLGIAITAEDNGPGIHDVFLAMQDGYSTGRGLGLGLPGVRRLMDEFEIFSEKGKGTKVSVIKWIF
ncbi:MAG: ATP-binding protein [Ignavibacteriales bacterium]